MKSLKVLAGVLCLVLVLATFGFSAQSQKKLNFYAGAGLQLPLGDWSDAADIGFNVQGGVLYPVYKMIDIQGGIGFFYNTGGESYYDLKVSNIVISVDGRYNLPLEKVKLFFIGGLGTYFRHAKLTAEYPELMMDEYAVIQAVESSTTNETNIGLRLGAGVAIGRHFEATAMFHVVSDTNMLSLGVAYRF
ncbi:MAG: outer membrane beta-barrel protein [Acidobacteriota bacterium]|nr:outer membrane beta-barrel protein [Acidobacteriota bacterium]